MRNLKIDRERPATSEEWDLAWESCAYATYFHSREWAEIWSAYTKGLSRPAPVLFLFSDGKKALLPATLKKRVGGLFEQCLLSPAGNYGGWLSADSLTGEHERILGDHLRVRYPNVIWRINPYGTYQLDLHAQGVIQDETHALDLSPGYPAICQKWQSDRHFILRKVRKAVSSGLTVKRAREEAEWRDYYRVYAECIRRWGSEATSDYREDLFREIRKRQSSYVRLWITLCEGRIIGGVLCFSAKKKVIAWHGVTLRQYFNFYPVNLLFSEVIKDACEGGNEWFDLNPSGGHEGVKAFKKSFSASPLPCPVLIMENKIARWVGRIRKGIHVAQKQND